MRAATSAEAVGLAVLMRILNGFIQREGMGLYLGWLKKIGDGKAPRFGVLFLWLGGRSADFGGQCGHTSLRIRTW